MDLLDLVRRSGFEPRKKAATNGGEYTTPCPSCGGNDRFIIWPYQPNSNGTEGAYWCRICEKKGDPIQFCVDFLEMNYPEAFRYCGIEKEASPQKSLFGKYPPYKESLIHEEKLSQANPTWQALLKSICLESNQTLLSSHSALEQFAKRGIPQEAIKEHRLGYLQSSKDFDRFSLNLPGSDKVWIPRGITIPTFEKDKLLRLKIRQSNQLPKYVAIPGSLSGLNIFSGLSKEIIFVLESELDAIALHWLVKDWATVIALGSNTKNPDSLSHSILRSCRKLIVIPDNDQGGDTMKTKWKSLYSKALIHPTPIGKDIGEAFQKGFDVANWVDNLK